MLSSEDSMELRRNMPAMEWPKHTNKQTIPPLSIYARHLLLGIAHYKYGLICKKLIYI